MDARLAAPMKEEESPHALMDRDLGRIGPLIAIGTLLVIGVVVISMGGARYKQYSEKTTVKLQIRLCQQAMRGHQNLHGLNPGDAFTLKDLEEYMRFPKDIEVPGGVVEFTPGTAVPPMGELWLKVKAPDTEGYIGRYGFESADEFKSW